MDNDKKQQINSLELKKLYVADFPQEAETEDLENFFKEFKIEKLEFYTK